MAKGQALFLRCIEATVQGVRRKVLIADDEESAEVLKQSRMTVGSSAAFLIDRKRDRSQWRAAHLLGSLLSDNLDDFSGLSAHETLKRLQVMSGLECDEAVVREAEAVCDCGAIVKFPALIARTPRSLSFGRMPQDRFNAFEKAIKRFVLEHYWFGSNESEFDKMLLDLATGGGGV